MISVTSRLAHVAAAASGIIALSAGVGVVSAAPASRTLSPSTNSWPQVNHGPAQDSFNTGETMLGRSNAAQLVPQWQVGVAQGPPTGPIVAGGSVYFADDAGIHAFRATTGKELLTIAPPKNFSSGGDPAWDAGIVFCEWARGAQAFELGAYNATTGAMLWSHTWTNSPTLDNTHQNLVVANGIVYIGVLTPSYGGQVVAFNETSGATIWTDNFSFEPSIALAGNDLVFNNFPNMGAVNSRSGAFLWTKAELATDGPMAVTSETIYGPVGCQVVAISVATGQQEWLSRTLPGCYNQQQQAGQLTGLAIAYGRIYADDFLGHTYALSSSSGNFLWAATGAPNTTGPPVVANGVVYSANQELAAVDGTSGKTLALITMPVFARAQIAIADARIFVPGLLNSRHSGLVAYGV